jgi:hypothetical protein
MKKAKTKLKREMFTLVLILSFVLLETVAAQNALVYSAVSDVTTNQISKSYSLMFTTRAY